MWLVWTGEDRHTLHNRGRVEGRPAKGARAAATPRHRPHTPVPRLRLCELRRGVGAPDHLQRLGVEVGQPVVLQQRYGGTAVQQQ